MTQAKGGPASPPSTDDGYELADRFFGFYHDLHHIPTDAGHRNDRSREPKHCPNSHSQFGQNTELFGNFILETIRNSGDKAVDLVIEQPREFHLLTSYCVAQTRRYV